MVYKPGDVISPQDSDRIAAGPGRMIIKDLSSHWDQWHEFIASEVEAGRCPHVTPVDIIVSTCVSFSSATVLGNSRPETWQNNRKIFLEMCAQSWDANAELTEAARGRMQ